ncbi:MAG: hypothetical protein GX643_14795 [Acidimicrobiales bacterium]|nr:hypothetical protein [Acidimicrobiales bacterium]
MSPVERSGHHAGRAALVALVGVVVLFGTLGLVSVALSGRNSPDLQLGDQTFTAGRAATLAERIAESGPYLFADVSGRKDRDMILQHQGDDPETGWSAFLAAPIDEPRDCTWDWQPDEQIFRAKCDPDRTAPADGEGLTQFEVTVIDGKVDVDLNADARDEATTTTSTAAG